MTGTVTLTWDTASQPSAYFRTFPIVSTLRHLTKFLLASSSWQNHASFVPSSWTPFQTAHVVCPSRKTPSRAVLLVAHTVDRHGRNSSPQMTQTHPSKVDSSTTQAKTPGNDSSALFCIYVMRGRLSSLVRSNSVQSPAKHKSGRNTRQIGLLLMFAERHAVLIYSMRCGGQRL